MIRAQQAPTSSHRHEASKPAMTAFASAILAALPGAGVQPEKAGAGGVADAAGVLGVFEALLAGLTQGEAFTGLGAGLTAEKAGDQDGDAAAQTADILPEGASADPALAAAASVALPFAPLTQALPTGEATEAAATIGKNMSTAAPAVPFAPTTDQSVSADATGPAPAQPQAMAAADVAVPAAATQAPASQTPAAPQAAAAPVIAVAPATPGAPVADAAPLLDAGDPAPAPEVPVEAAPRVAVAPASAAAPQAAPTATPTVQAEASRSPAQTVQTFQTAQAVPVSMIAQAASASDGDIDPMAAVAQVVGGDPGTETAATSAPVQVAVAPASTAPAAKPATAGDLRRAAVAAKGDQASAVASYLDGLDGAERAEAAPEATIASVDAQPDMAAEFAPASLDVAETDEPRGQAAAPEARAAAAQATLHDAAAPAASRASAETVAKLSADIVRKLDGQASTRFDLQLDPHGMGKVDVSIEIDRDGRLTAALSFDSAQAASDLKGRSAELRAALEQAGFEVADSALSFDFSGQNSAGFGGRETGEQAHAWSGRAFQTAQVGLDEADARAALSSRSRAAAGGVDIRI